MKKLLAFILVFTLVLGLGAVASATVPESKNYEDETSVTINKDVTIKNDGTAKPSETFSFTVDEGTGLRDGVDIDAPGFDQPTFTITVAQGEATGSANIDLPEFTQVGVYTYPITEIAGSTAGMRYDGATYHLRVTVINEADGDGFLRVLTVVDENDVKTDAFQNDFYAGSLTVKKEVTGNYGDPNDEFTITVTVTPDQDKVINPAPIVWNTKEPSDVSVSEGVYTATYTLKGGGDFTIQNLPYDVSYKVEETQAAGYNPPGYDDNKEGKFKAASVETTITNHRELEIATGINLDSLPYLIILAVAIAGLAIFIVRRRMAVNE